MGDQGSTPTPTISGAAEMGQQLTADVGTLDSGVTLTYQWLATGIEVAGATTSSYPVRTPDVGNRITVQVTGTRSGYAPVTKESAASRATTRPAAPARLPAR